MAFYVYIANCADGAFYTGIAKDPEARLKKHNAGKGAKYMRGKRLPAKLVYVSPKRSLSDALIEEAFIKTLTRRDKVWFMIRRAHGL